MAQQGFPRLQMAPRPALLGHASMMGFPTAAQYLINYCPRETSCRDVGKEHGMDLHNSTLYGCSGPCPQGVS